MSPTGTAVFVLATTGAYSLSRVAAKRFPSPFTTPVFFGTAVVIAILMLGGFSVTDYDGAKSIITYLLGPATVALTVPLYKNRKTLIGNMAPVMAGLLAGSLALLVDLRHREGNPHVVTGFAQSTDCSRLFARSP